MPVILRDLLLDALTLRDRRDAGPIAGVDYEAEVADLEARVKALVARRGHAEENRRLLKHLRNEAPALFTFLRHEGVDATNWRAEQGVRPRVVNRKVWGGSRTDNGARAHERLVSVLRTAAQQGEDALAIPGDLIRSPVRMVAPLAGVARKAPEVQTGFSPPTDAKQVRGDLDLTKQILLTEGRLCLHCLSCNRPSIAQR